MTTDPDRARSAVRAARSAAAVSLAEAASAVGCSPSSLRRALRTRQPRGRCAAAAVAMFESASPEARAKAAAHPAAPPTVRRLAGVDDEPTVGCGGRGAASWRSHRHDATTADGPRTRRQEAVPAAAEAELPVWRYAEHYRCAAMLARLSTCHASAVRTRVLGSETCPVWVLAMAASYTDSVSPRTVAANPACPPRALASLAVHPDASTRDAVTRNPACPSTLLDQLCGDLDDWVAQTAVQKLHTTMPTRPPQPGTDR